MGDTLALQVFDRLDVAIGRNDQLQLVAQRSVDL
ncbi:hypothetical protein ABID44_003733 [Aquamicrobium ahrensii]|uniref:Uncharacterized protein n=1 Tax=Aquamicrobium ahrensii TaxID=469551 RepID=A0ABV2KRC1_9HYPH